MISREDSRRLAQMERQLRRDDPDFCARMEGGRPETSDRPRRIPLSLLVLVAVVIWIAAVVLAVVGWWIAASALAAASATIVVAALVYRARRPRLT